MYDAYVVSLATIGINWNNPHAAMPHLIRADRRVLLLNLMLLGCVSLIPWPTGLTAEYLRVGGNEERVAAIVFAGVMAGMGLSFGAMWRYASTRRRLITSDLSDDELRRSTRRFTVGGPIYVLAMAIALVSAPASLAIIGALAVYYMLPSAVRSPIPPRPTTTDSHGRPG